MTEELKILVTVQVDHDEDAISAGQRVVRRASVVEGIRHAVKYGEDQGFVHPCAEEISIGVCDVELVDEPDEDSGPTFVPRRRR